MTRTALIYSTKLWLTGVLLGPIIYLMWIFPPGKDFWDIGQYLLLAIVGALVMTFPCWLLLWGGALFILKKSVNRTQTVRKLMLAAWCLLLTTLPMLLLFANDDPNTGNDTIRIWISYLAPIIAAVCWFRLPSWQKTTTG